MNCQTTLVLSSVPIFELEFSLYYKWSNRFLYPPSANMFMPTYLCAQYSAMNKVQNSSETCLICIIAHLHSSLVSGPELVLEDYEFMQRSVRQGKMHFGHLI